MIKRILLTVHQFFPEYKSGTEVLTYSVAKELMARGFDVAVLTGSPEKEVNAAHDEYVFDGIKVYRFYYHATAHEDKSLSNVEQRNNNPLAEVFFRQICEDFKPDIVHFFHLDRLGPRLIKAAHSLKIPSFMTPTDFWSICPTAQLMLCDGSLCSGASGNAGNCLKHVAEITQSGMAQTVIRRVPSRAFGYFAKLGLERHFPNNKQLSDISAIKNWRDNNVKHINTLNKILSPNAFMTQKMIESGVSADLFVQVPYGVSEQKYAQGNVRKRTEQPLKIGFVGTLSFHKGCHILIQAFNALPLGSSLLKIYGNKDDFPDYVEELGDLSDSNSSIEFCGTFQAGDIGRVMNELDVLVVPPLWYENTPLVVYSAQAQGCPVIASNMPSLAESIRDNYDGLLFEAGEVGELAESLTRLLNETGLLRRLSKNTISPKSIPNYVDDLIGVWKG